MGSGFSYSSMADEFRECAISNPLEQALLIAVLAEKLPTNTAAMIMAQCEHESMGFTHMEECLNYSAERLLEVFPAYFRTLNFAKVVANNGPQAIANLVYQNRMGNGPSSTGDGWKYRGRGFIMLTGKDNYQSASKVLGIDLCADPDLVKMPEHAAKIAIAYFKRKPWLMKAAEAGDVLAASSWINLGHYKPGSIHEPLGLESRTVLFADWLKKLSGSPK